MAEKQEHSAEQEPKVVTISPVTRIEGHARISIFLDEQDRVADARLHIEEFRGFEKFCEGRLFVEMPSITQRICGICPISHHLASIKAGDQIIGATIPPAARLTRELIHVGQVSQSHALSFFHLSAPDLLLGFDADPAVRNIMGLIEHFPDIARKGVQLRKYGQKIIEAIAGRRIHPTFGVPGGVNHQVTEEMRERLKEGLDEALEIAHFALDLFKDYYLAHREEVHEFANFPTAYLGLVREDGALELYDGFLRLVDANGEILEEKVDPTHYLDFIAEAVEPWTYLKFPFYRKRGYPEGIYRVGPLARLNVCDFISTPQAEQARQEFFELVGTKPVHGSFFYHYARLIEIIYALERAGEILNTPELTDEEILVVGPVVNERGVGVIEAPRGVLIHDYHVDRNGVLQKVNLVVSTGHNNLGMNRAVQMIAKKYVDGRRLQEGMLNRVEAAVRCYDPCLSCSTHALGQMPLRIELYDAHGALIQTLER
ncbi:MAG: NADP oxidoreductase [Candidatus Poribacteria bacterium]|nr:MAG: NADP oxidoreductase [Candidatus Poribacteria bacterium]